MNCKPGDLARIVSPYQRKEHIDLFVTVVRAGVDGHWMAARNGGWSLNSGDGSHGWVCDANRPDFPCFIDDKYLRPLRDPGDDAQDETLQWLPVPSKEGAPA
jgi:hypothetical protein